MKRISIILSTIFLLAGMSANAQIHGDTHHNRQQESSHMNTDHRYMQSGHMMGGNANTMYGMMGRGMMNRHGSGMMHYGMLTHLPMLDEELDLSSDQIDRMKEMKEAFRDETANLNNKINEERQRLAELASNDASPEQYRSQLKSYYQSVMDLQESAYETSNKMKDVLTEKQRQKLENQVADLQHHHNEDVQDDHYMDERHGEGMRHNW